MARKKNSASKELVIEELAEKYSKYRNEPEPEKNPNCIEYWKSIEIPVKDLQEPSLEENIARAHSMLPYCFQELPKGCGRDSTYFMEEVMKYLTIELQQLSELIRNVEQEYMKVMMEKEPEVA